MTVQTVNTPGSDDLKKPMREKTLEELAEGVVRLQGALETYWKNSDVRRQLSRTYEQHVREYFERDLIDEGYKLVGWVSHFHITHGIKPG